MVRAPTWWVQLERGRGYLLLFCALCAGARIIPKDATSDRPSAVEPTVDCLRPGQVGWHDSPAPRHRPRRYSNAQRLGCALSEDVARRRAYGKSIEQVCEASTVDQLESAGILMLRAGTWPPRAPLSSLPHRTTVSRTSYIPSVRTGARQAQAFIKTSMAAPPNQARQ